MASTAMTATILTGAKSVVGSIRYWANHGQLPVDQILEQAQALIYSRIRIQEMITTGDVTLALGDDNFALPARFVAPVKLELDVYGEVPYIHESGIMRDRDASGDLYPGIPDRFTWQNGRLEFNCELMEAVNGDFTYYQSLEPLVATSNETNVLTDKFPTLLRRGCMVYAFEARFRQDMMDKELILFEKAVDEVNTASDLARLGQVMR